MNKKSIIALVLAMVMMMSLLAGCSKGGSKVDSTKTHLSVLCYDGGIGSEWAKNAAKRFEEKYANVSFEEGKMGVVVDITNDKLDGKNGVTTTPYAIWFTESVNFNELIATNQIVDISDIVTGSLSDASNGAETGSIEDKLAPEFKEALTAVNGKY